jgi:pimeloyl-ACP methyl ester carboxylesterase
MPAMRASVAVDGLEIAYERAGEGPPLVLLHGAMADGRTWRPQLEGLADRLTVIAWDEPGAGGSADPSADFGLADYADALAGLIGALGFDAAHVGGVSWGGVVALELYRRNPDRVASLILADTYAGWKGSLPAAECAQRLAHAIEQSRLPPERFEPTLPGLLAPGAPAAVADDLAAIMAEARPESMRRTAAALATCDQRDLLARIAAPTLLIWGEDDVRSPLFVAEQFRAAIPGARFVLIPDAGHMANLEQPALFNAAVGEFCAEQAR